MRAIEIGLVPVSLQNMYKKDITRGEFAELITETLSGITEQSIDELLLRYTGTSVVTNDYVDTTNYYVSVASALGIVNGNGNGYYKPYDTISREEAATMLARVAVLLGHNLPTELALGVDDDSKVSNWAYESVVYVIEEGIMNGTGGNMFSPSQTYTREQSYMTVLRLFFDVGQG